MAVTVTHKEWQDRQDEWETIRDVLAGRNAVMIAGARYVPMLGGQEQSQYRSYLMRGAWGGFTARTHEGVVGLIFSQDPQWEVPDAIEPLMEDFTLTDMSFTEFAKAVVAEVFAYSWGGILVDVNPETEQGEPQDDRPYAVHYDAMSVRWWDREKIGGVWKTTTVILHEYTEVPLPPDPNDPGSEYGTQTIEQYRVLKLRPEVFTNPAGVKETTYLYRQEIWQYIEDSFGKQAWVKVEDIVPKRGMETLTDIPWAFTTAEGIEPCISKSHLLDVAEVNLDHWRLMVDLRHGGHFSALPTPCAAGMDDVTMDVQIGSESFLKSSNPAFKTWYLEPAGTGLGFLRGEVDAAEDLMAVLGARMLETQKREAETAEAMTIRQSGEQSAVMTVALSVSKALEKALWWMAWWRNVENAKVSVNLTAGLTNLQLTVQDLQFMLSALNAGRLSPQGFVEAVIRSGRIVGRTAEEEQILVDEEQKRRQEAQIEQAKLMPQGPPQRPGFPPKRTT